MSSPEHSAKPLLRCPFSAGADVNARTEAAPDPSRRVIRECHETWMSRAPNSIFWPLPNGRMLGNLGA